MTAQRVTGYIPVTMDELMARFVTNMERDDCEDEFHKHKTTIFKSNLRQVDQVDIESSVKNSF